VTDERLPRRAPAAGTHRGAIAQLVLDDPARPVNVVDERALEDLEAALGLLEARPDLGGLIVRSGKPGTFVAGADLDGLAALTDRAQALARVRRAQAAFARLAALPFPTVAAIDGPCLGEGTGLALACSSRVAAREPHTQIGVPRSCSASSRPPAGTTACRDRGAVDRAGPHPDGSHARCARRRERGTGRAGGARRVAARARAPAPGELAARGRGRGHAPAAGRPPAATSGGPGAALVARGRHAVRAGPDVLRARAMTRARTGGHYPAPIAALSVLHHGFAQPAEASLRLEAEWVSDLVVGPVCKNLVRAFQLAERARKGPCPDRAGRSPSSGSRSWGRGRWGRASPSWRAVTGSRCGLRDTDPAALARALREVRARVAGRAGRPGAARHETEAQLARLFPGLDLAGLKRTDLAIEAVVEDLDVKRRVFGELEVRMRPDAVLATTPPRSPWTSWPRGWSTAALRRDALLPPGPPHAVGRGGARREDLGRRAGHGRRAGAPAGQDAGRGERRARLRREPGADALPAGGPPPGRGRLPRDRRGRGHAGLRHAPGAVRGDGRDGPRRGGAPGRGAGRAFPGRVTPAPRLEALVEAGLLGRKRGAGFYRYWAGGARWIRWPRGCCAPPARAGTRASSRSPKRMVLAMVNEAAHCLADGVVGTAGMLDLALLYGAGFPPHAAVRYATPTRWASPG